jgi:Lrp/AsnC family leucine-responsive transcriptional regulator
MMDELDRAILNMLQENARVPYAEIARRVGMVPSGVLDRVRRLEGRGVIEGYEARLNAEALGLGALAFVFVRADDRPGPQETGGLLAEIPGVLEVHHIAGEDSYLVKVRVADTRSLGRLLRERFGSIERVRSTRTAVVLATMKELGRLPLSGERIHDRER